MKKLLLLFCLGFSNVVQAYPYKCTVMTGPGTLIPGPGTKIPWPGKKVYLLHDVHESVICRQTSEYKNSKEALEQILSARIAKETNGIAFLWEAHRALIKKYQNWYQLEKHSVIMGPNQWDDSYMLLSLGYMVYAACAKSSKAHFVGCDNFRGDLGNIVDMLVDASNGIGLPALTGEAIAKLPETLLAITSSSYQPIKDLLNEVRKHTDIKTYHFLENEWYATKQLIWEWVNGELNELLCKLAVPEMGVIDDSLGSRAINKGWEAIIRRLCDIEFLLSIFAQPDNEIVIYAGGAHCQAIEAYLEQLGFTSKVVSNPNQFKKNEYLLGIMPLVVPTSDWKKLEDSLKTSDLVSPRVSDLVSPRVSDLVSPRVSDLVSPWWRSKYAHWTLGSLGVGAAGILGYYWFIKK